jgi:SWI/SNF-related matrix-associated actin-dependent regulator 1 of chromatin subfamily A
MMQATALQRFLEYKQQLEAKDLPVSKDEDLLTQRNEVLKRKILYKEAPIKTLIPVRQVAAPEPDEPLFEPLPEGKADQGNKIIIKLELYSKDDILAKSNVFIAGSVRDAILNAAGIYCKENCGFILPVKMYQCLKKNLDQIKGVTLQEIPDFVVRALADNRPISTKKWQFDYADEIPKSTEILPEFILSKLYAFQLEGVNFALGHFGRALIGDEMGVGKTIQAIAAAYCYMDEWPVLIICPASIKYNWRDEFMRWIPTLEKKDFYILKSKRTMKNSAKVWIASYNMAMLLDEMLCSKILNVVIADECHYLKNYNAKRTKNILPILQRARRVLMLSGTPVMSRPAELFTQLAAIRPDVFFSFKVFADRYCDPKVLFTHTDYSGSSNIKELFTLISNTVMIRRLKSDVMAQLPAKLRQKIEIPVVAEHCRSIKKLYYEVKKKKEFFKDIAVSDVGANDVELAAKKMETDMFMSKAYMLTSKAKMKGVAEYVSYLIQSECKFIIFAHHLEMLDAIQEQVIKENVKFIRIDGSTSSDGRYRGVQAFQNNKDCLVAVLSILAAGQGLTLTAASTVVIAEMAWAPGVMIQAEDRAHRIGQVKSVNIHYLFGPNTLDEYIWPKIQGKLNIVTGALDNHKNVAVESLIHPQYKIGMGDFEVEDDILNELGEFDLDNESEGGAEEEEPDEDFDEPSED